MRERVLIAVVAAAAALGVAAPGAMARDAYVANSGSGSVSVVDTGTSAVAATVAVRGEPVDVAISPDGSRAYVANRGANAVDVIDTRSHAQVATVPVGVQPAGIAVSPDGSHAWVTNAGSASVSVIYTGTEGVVATIPVGLEPDGIAISPDGSRAFVAQRSGGVAIVDTGSHAVVGAIPDTAGPSRITLTPDGSRGLVTNAGEGSVTVFDPSSGAVVGEPIAVGEEPAGIAVSPDGKTAYAASPAGGTVTPIDVAHRSAGGAIGFAGATGVALAPSGKIGFVTDGSGGSVTVLDAARGQAGGAIGVGTAPTAVAVVPDQAPSAHLFIAPFHMRAGQRLFMLAGASKDPDGAIADYAFDFGDGSGLDGESPSRLHRYGQPGVYHVTVTETDDEGCSTATVYTGQTAYCNGSDGAAFGTDITVVNARGPFLRLAAAKRQRLRGRVFLYARCPREECTVRVGGVVVVGFEREGHERRFRRPVRPARETLAEGAVRRLGVVLPRPTRRAVLWGLRQGGSAEVQLSLLARGPGGNLTLRRRHIELVWAPRHRRGGRHRQHR